MTATSATLRGRACNVLSVADAREPPHHPHDMHIYLIYAPKGKGHLANEAHCSFAYGNITSFGRPPH